MPLAPGTRLGSYQIASRIGAGGMGEVYRALDTKLNRDVAIKVLPDLFASDRDRLMRFEREAQTLAALNHANIAQVYGVLEEPPALVMEFVDGEDLAERLARGAVPTGEALGIAGQLVDALDAAHERGIIHRDLKPANIKIRPDGTVKVLDFGLAKALGADAARDAPSSSAFHLENSPTYTSPAMTQLGMILGTAAYMAPEQAKGKPVDKRADIWAFGCVLFEMLTGRRPFPGDDVSETLASVLAREVDWTALPAGTPTQVRQLLRACLQKDPRHRLRDIADARLQLQAVADAPVSRGSSSRIPGWWWAAALVLVTAVAAAALTSGRGAVEVERPAIAMLVPVTTGGTFWNPVLSADGRLLVFGGERISVRPLGEFETRSLPGTENGIMPFLSPDGKWIGFYADEKIKKVAISGGHPVDIAPVSSDTPGAAWGLDNRIYFSRGWNDSNLVSVPADGGDVTEVSTLDRASGERGHWWPHPLPDGRHILFTIWYAAAGLSEAKIGVLDLQTKTHRVLFPGAMARYAAGHLLYYRAGGYYLVPFDAATLEVTGDLQPVLTDAAGLLPQGTPLMPVAVSDAGTIAYLSGALFPTLDFAWVSADGRLERTGLRGELIGTGDLSPDGRRVALGRPQRGTAQVLVADVTGANEQRLAASGMNWTPVWHPDGQRVAFLSMRKGDFDIYVQRSDGSAEERIVAGDRDEEPVSWTQDGRRIVMKEWLADGSTSLVLFDPSSQARTPLVTGTFQKWESRLSPDGRWIAIVAAATGVWHVHLRRTDGSGGFPQISPNGVVQQSPVRWSPGSDRVYYLRDWNLVSVSVREESGRVVTGPEQVLVQMPRNSTLIGVHPDGERVLVGLAAPRDPALPPGIRVLVNGLRTLTRQ